MSIAHASRLQLESIGEYVTRANVDWFAIFPDKLTEQETIAAQNGRESNLVVYRTRSADKRDHHVIPLSQLTSMLTAESLTHSDVNGTVRWNVTLKNHVVKVSHSNVSVNVEEYFQSDLAVENGSDAVALRPVDLDPPLRIETVTYRILRDTVAARQLKTEHECRCQICGTTIDLQDGSRYAEAHHIRPLGSRHNGPDVRENMLVLCPNHHAMCDYGVIPLARETLREIVGHAVHQSFIDYHNEMVYRSAREATG